MEDSAAAVLPRTNPGLPPHAGYGRGLGVQQREGSKVGEEEYRFCPEPGAKPPRRLSESRHCFTTTRDRDPLLLLLRRLLGLALSRVYIGPGPSARLYFGSS